MKIKLIFIGIVIIIIGFSVYYLFKNKELEQSPSKINSTSSTGTTNKSLQEGSNNGASTTFYSKDAIQKLSSKEKNQIITSANKILNLKSLPSVTDKTKLIAEGETKNDYVSIAPYLWQSTEDANKYVVKDGVDNPERLNSDEFDSQRLNDFASDLNKLTLAYTITGDEKYSAMANKLLYTWFINSETKMNPSMKYAEIFVTKSGRTVYTGSSMISSVPMINVVNDIELLGNAVSSTNTTGLKAWFNSFADWLLAQNGGNIDKLRINNHGTWLDADLASFYSYAGNTAKVKNILNAVGPYAINPQIQASGKIPSALVRTKSLDYTEYNLEAFITLANIADNYGINIWDYKSPNGGSIEHAIEYVTNYLLGKTKWEYQNIKGKDVNESKNEKFAMYLKVANEHYKNNDFNSVVNKYSKNNLQVQLI